MVGKDCQSHYMLEQKTLESQIGRNELLETECELMLLNCGVGEDS